MSTLTGSLSQYIPCPGPALGLCHVQLGLLPPPCCLGPEIAEHGKLRHPGLKSDARPQQPRAARVPRDPAQSSPSFHTSYLKVSNKLVFKCESFQILIAWRNSGGFSWSSKTPILNTKVFNPTKFQARAPKQPVIHIHGATAPRGALKPFQGCHATLALSGVQT